MKENEQLMTKKNQSSSVRPSYSYLLFLSLLHLTFVPANSKTEWEWKGELKEWRTGRKKAAKFARKSWLNVRWCVKLIAGEALAHAAMSHILQGIGSSTQRGCRKKREKSFFFFTVYKSHLSYHVLSLTQFNVKTHSFWLLVLCDSMSW